jgi:hypothetical protein
MQVTRHQHVYALAVRLKSGPCYVYMCECMAGAWEALQGHCLHEVADVDGELQRRSCYYMAQILYPPYPV